MPRFEESRAAAAVLILTSFGVGFPSAATLAQEVNRVPVVVDYVGVEGVYLPIGTDQGAQVGDSLRVFAADTATTPLGILLFTAASRSRSVATMLEPAFELQRGDSLYVSLPTAEVTAGAPNRPGIETAQAAGEPSRQASTEGGPRVSGRVTLEVDARQTRVSWEGADLFGRTTRTFATPVSNVSLRVADLPGGFRLEMNARGSYRYSDGVAIKPERSVRVYNLSAVKVFERAPVEVRLGRFYNSYETYSGYWDGALVRVGRRTGPGIGVVAGFDPNRGDERPSGDVRKVTGFADFSARGASWRYDTDISVHFLRPAADSLPDRRFAAWTQQGSVGRMAFSQRLRLDRDESGSWSLAQLRLRTGVSLVGGLRLNLAYGRSRPGLFRGSLLQLSPEREEMTAGFSVFGGASSLMFDAGSSQWADKERGFALSGSASTRVGSVQLFLSGRRWSRAGMTSLAAAPSIGFGGGWLATRLGSQFYRTRGMQTLTSQAGTVELTATPSAGLWITLRAEQQWSRALDGTRIRLTVGRSF